jgi:hypothetical protein
MPRKDIHIVPEGNEWLVESTDYGSELSFDTQAEALDYGRRVAKEEHADLFIHGHDGEIRAADSYAEN